MQRELRITEDGSHTFYLPGMDENYHSTHGAIQESQHVFIEAGLKQVNKNEVNILEVGFGTGLNALLTLLEAQQLNLQVRYTGIEKYPLSKEEYSHLNYASLLKTECRKEFMQMHETPWEQQENIVSNFQLIKTKEDIITCSFDPFPFFDLVYFDAFAPNKQDGVWNREIFRKIYARCNQGAIFVTYCAKGSVRRDLQDAGFTMERIPGPPGKKEMLRGRKD